MADLVGQVVRDRPRRVAGRHVDLDAPAIGERPPLEAGAGGQEGDLPSGQPGQVEMDEPDGLGAQLLDGRSGYGRSGGGDDGRRGRGRRGRGRRGRGRRGDCGRHRGGGRRRNPGRHHRRAGRRGRGRRWRVSADAASGRGRPAVGRVDAASLAGDDHEGQRERGATTRQSVRSAVYGFPLRPAGLGTQCLESPACRHGDRARAHRQGVSRVRRAVSEHRDQNEGGGPGTVGTIAYPAAMSRRSSSGSIATVLARTPPPSCRITTDPGFTAPRMRSRSTSGGGRR